MKSFVLLALVWSGQVLAQMPTSADLENQRIVDSLFGADKNQKFSYHQPIYFIFGDDDLKLQFSFKYRLAKTFNLYFAYTQLMFWDIYEESKPFEDVNYNPELFYRLLEAETGIFKSFDMGWLHTSNGQKDEESRSLNRLFIRSNIVTKIGRHNLGAVLMAYEIYDEDSTNADITNYMGYWNARFCLSHLVNIERQQIDLEFMTYAGSKVYDLDKGGYLVGLIYRVGSDNFNPAIYFQRFEGYAENLINYNHRRTEYRLGLMLYF